MTNSLDPDQARRFVGPDLGPNCLPRLAADVTGRQRVKGLLVRPDFDKLMRPLKEPISASLSVGHTWLRDYKTLFMLNSAEHEI